MKISRVEKDGYGKHNIGYLEKDADPTEGTLGNRSKG